MTLKRGRFTLMAAEDLQHIFAKRRSEVEEEFRFAGTAAFPWVEGKVERSEFRLPFYFGFHPCCDLSQMERSSRTAFLTRFSSEYFRASESSSCNPAMLVCNGVIASNR